MRRSKSTDLKMVVLDAGSPPSALPGSALAPMAAASDPTDPMDTLRCGYAQSSPSPMKIVSKRFINIHQWLGPVCAKQLKEAVVSGLGTTGSGRDAAGCL